MVASFVIFSLLQWKDSPPSMDVGMIHWTILLCIIRFIFIFLIKTLSVSMFLLSQQTSIRTPGWRFQKTQNIIRHKIRNISINIFFDEGKSLRDWEGLIDSTNLMEMWGKAGDTWGSEEVSF